MKLKSETLFEILFYSCVLAATLLPKQAEGQILDLTNVEISTTDSVWIGIGPITKDTVTVAVLCENYKAFWTKEEWIGIDSLSTLTTDVYRIEKKQVLYQKHGLSIENIKQERTFEVRSFYEFVTTDTYEYGSVSGYDSLVTRPVQILSRWLDDIEGCYELVPLENPNGLNIDK